MQALGEVWIWLRNHGLVTWSSTQDSPDAIVISRAGHEALCEGLPWLRAVERLDMALTPALTHKARPQFIRGDFELAAFAAMKEVEVCVRQRDSAMSSRCSARSDACSFSNA